MQFDMASVKKKNTHKKTIFVLSVEQSRELFLGHLPWCTWWNCLEWLQSALTAALQPEHEVDVQVHDRICKSVCPAANSQQMPFNGPLDEG